MISQRKRLDDIHYLGYSTYGMLHALNEYETELLSGWEEIYKRGQLTLWILLALLDGPKHMAAVKDYIQAHTQNMLSADDQSMYRALRRYHETDLVAYTTQQIPNGPDRKVYALTATGRHVLHHFVRRNMPALRTQPMITKIIKEENI